MPQMSPLSWELLFIYFMTIYIMINIMIYWQMNKYPQSKTMLNKKSKYSWKW